MGYLAVFLVAAAAGIGVAAWTLRRAGAPIADLAAWRGGGDEPEAPASPARRRPLPDDPTWRSRLTGVLGLAIACLAAAALLVILGYLAWAGVTRLFG